MLGTFMLPFLQYPRYNCRDTLVRIFLVKEIDSRFIWINLIAVSMTLDGNSYTLVKFSFWKVLPNIKFLQTYFGCFGFDFNIIDNNGCQVYTKEITYYFMSWWCFMKWILIIESFEKEELQGKNINPSDFICMCGLDMDEVRSIQMKIIDISTLISKGFIDNDKEDMGNYILKKSRTIS